MLSRSISLVFQLGAFLFFLVGSTSCTNQDASQKLYQTYLSENPLLEQWIDSELNFPDQLMALEHETNFEDFINRESEKMIIYLDAGCSDCISSISQWHTFLELNKTEDLEVSFILGGLKGYASYAIAMSEFNETDYLVYVDEAYAFEKDNDLPDNKVYHSFLLNKANEVVLMGSPIVAPFLATIYANQLSR